MPRRIAAGICVFTGLLAAWIGAGPFVAARQIRAAVIAGDAMALDQRIDFPAVRDSLKGQLYGLVEPPQAPGAANPTGSSGFGGAIKAFMGTALDVLLTPQGVLELLRHKTALAQGAAADGGAPAAPDESEPPQGKPMLHYRFVSTDRFEVTVAEADAPDAPATLVLRRYGLEWKLAAIELPLLREVPGSPESP